jgi:alkylated DNA repair dioxygenase AlkB
MQTLLETNKSTLFFKPSFIDDILCKKVKNIPLIENVNDDTLSPYLIIHPPIYIYGKECKQHRNIGFFSDDSEGYYYANQLAKSQPLTSWMKTIIAKVNKELNTDFNAILINHYENGTEYIGKHSDDEKYLGNNKVAIISLGQPRRFVIKDKTTGNVILDVKTKHKGLMIMEGDFQKEFTHEIPCEKTIKLPRWSLTFRKHTK